MVKTRHGMKVFAAAEAELRAEGGLAYQASQQTVIRARPVLPSLMLCAGADHPPGLCLRPVPRQNCLGMLGLFTLSRCIVQL